VIIITICAIDQNKNERTIEIWKIFCAIIVGPTADISQQQQLLTAAALSVFSATTITNAFYFLSLFFFTAVFFVYSPQFQDYKST